MGSSAVPARAMDPRKLAPRASRPLLGARPLGAPLVGALLPSQHEPSHESTKTLFVFSWRKLSVHSPTCLSRRLSQPDAVPAERASVSRAPTVLAYNASASAGVFATLVSPTMPSSPSAFIM